MNTNVLDETDVKNEMNVKDETDVLNVMNEMNVLNEFHARAWVSFSLIFLIFASSKHSFNKHEHQRKVFLLKLIFLP